MRAAAMVAAGVGLVAAVLYHVGVGEVAALVAALGWRAPLILVPYATATLLDVKGWQRTLTHHARLAVSFTRLYWIRMAGEAVNNLTPFAGLGGEPVKAYLLRQHGVHGSDGVASVVIAKGALISAQIVFTLAGIGLLLDRLGLLRDRVLALAAAWAVGLAIVGLLVLAQRRGLVAWSAQALRRLGLRGRFVTRLEDSARDIDSALIRFYRDDPRGFLTATLYHFVAWIFGAAEVILILFLMGTPCTWRDALIIESVTQATMASSAIIPGGLGVQELSGAVLCRFLGIGEAPGVALMLLKRAREIAVSLVGLLTLSLLARRSRTASPEA